MRRTYRKQREEGEAKREPERVRESKKEDKDTNSERTGMIQQSNICDARSTRYDTTVPGFDTMYDTVVPGYDAWYYILGMIYSNAAAYFIAMRSQFRTRRTYRKQREERETKREPQRVRESSLRMSRGNSLSDE